LGAACVLVAACGGGNKSTKVGGKLTIDNESGSTWDCQFNPFNTAATLGLTAIGWVYEPLEYVNILKSGSTGRISATPWLATSSKWSNAFKTLTFTIRKGVKWTDGKPFTAQDVVYSFNAMKSKAIDLDAVWANDGGPLTGVAASGSDQVVFTFKSPAQQYFYYIADQTPIVPQHIWSSLNQTKLISYKDPSPVGTGPYKVANCTAQNIKYLRNPDYWQAKPGHPVPAVKEVDYPSFLSNTSANLALSQGQAQWGGQYVPNIKSFWVAKDPAHRHYWFAPVLNVNLIPNLSNPLLSKLAVRQAIAYAIDKSKVSRLGESGYQKPANQTGVVTPTFQGWFDSSLTQPTYDPAKAQQILNSAGFKKGSNGIYQDKSGHPLSFTVKTVSGFSDWDASLAVISQELKAVGIGLTVQDENSTPYTTDLQSGHFQLAYAGSGGPSSAVGGPTPYYELRGLLFSGNIGLTDYSRYKSASTDALFNQYGGANLAQQHQIIDKIQKVMVDQVPFIPVTEGVDWYQYDTSNFTGWPTPSNPYAQPSPYQAPDLEVVLTRLRPLH
jgi:peptide/nickel transport system substrate-binding protein